MRIIITAFESQRKKRLGGTGTERSGDVSRLPSVPHLPLTPRTASRGSTFNVAIVKRVPPTPSTPPAQRVSSLLLATQWCVRAVSPPLTACVASEDGKQVAARKAPTPSRRSSNSRRTEALEPKECHKSSSGARGKARKSCPSQYRIPGRDRASPRDFAARRIAKNWALTAKVQPYHCTRCFQESDHVFQSCSLHLAGVRDQVCCWGGNGRVLVVVWSGEGVDVGRGRRTERANAGA